MRIIIRPMPMVGKNFLVEAESFDTISYVKGKIRDKEGFCRLDQRLIFAGEKLEDSRTLADYDIQNESTIDLIITMRGGTEVYIKNLYGKMLPVGGVLISNTIKGVKAQIHETMYIPIDEQRLMFAGKELEDGRTIEDHGIKIGSTLRFVRLRSDDAVDIAAVQARRRAVQSKAKGTGNQADAVNVLPEVGSKRAREDSSAIVPQGFAWGLMSCGANRAEGVESFWDEEDFGLAWRRSRSLISPYDTSKFESKADRTLIESVANDCVRTLNVTAFLESRLLEYKDRLSQTKNEVKRLTEENACLKESLQKEKDEYKKLMQELDMERLTGTFFLQSEVGRRHIVTLERQAAKSAVDDFKKSAMFKEFVMERAMSVYDDVVKECQRLLRKSGRVSEDIVQLLDPYDSHHEDEDEEEDDDEEEEEEDDDDEDDDDKEEEDGDDDDDEEEEEEEDE